MALLRQFDIRYLVTKDGACIFCNSDGGTDLCIEFLEILTDGGFWPEVADFIAHAE